MRAIVQHSFGGPEVLAVEQRPVPEPTATEVRVRVQAAGVNPVDWKTRGGKGIAAQWGCPLTVGWDVAGVVDAVGPGVQRFAVGDPVLGMPWFPRPASAYAEYVTAPSLHFARRPDALGVVEAGGLPLAGLTAWQSLVDVARVQPGQRVLVHAGAGGVGHLAVQIAKARGAHVIATASAAKHGLLTELGVDEAVDYREQKFEEVVEPVDVVYDLIGGEVSVRSLDVLRPDGVIIILPSAAAAAAIEQARERGLRALGVVVEPDGRGLEQLTALVGNGALRVLVDETFPLDRAGDAHRLGEQGRTTGKIVLEI